MQHTRLCKGPCKSFAILVCLGQLVACQPQPDAVQTGLKEATPQVESLRPVSAAVFDIPALLHQSVVQVRAKLGPPLDELQANTTDTERSLVYKKRGLILTVDYFVGANQVEVISLTGARDTTSFQHLLPLGNLKPTNRAYTIDTLRSEHAGLYRGIAVRLSVP